MFSSCFSWRSFSFLFYCSPSINCTLFNPPQLYTVFLHLCPSFLRFHPHSLSLPSRLFRFIPIPKLFSLLSLAFHHSLCSFPFFPISIPTFFPIQSLFPLNLLHVFYPTLASFCNSLFSLFTTFPTFSLPHSCNNSYTLPSLTFPPHSLPFLPPCPPIHTSLLRKKIPSLNFSPSLLFNHSVSFLSSKH